MQVAPEPSTVEMLRDLVIIGEIFDLNPISHSCKIGDVFDLNQIYHRCIIGEIFGQQVVPLA